MLTIRRMKPEDHETVFPMVLAFYQSDAVEHELPASVLEHTFRAACAGRPDISGWVLEAEGALAGFAYLSAYFSSEAGESLMLEELYIRPPFRGRGYGTQFLSWMLRSFPNVRRFRLEVTRQNERAVALYQRMGFRDLAYRQMVLDRPADAAQA